MMIISNNINSIDDENDDRDDDDDVVIEKIEILIETINNFSLMLSHRAKASLILFLSIFHQKPLRVPALMYGLV